MAGRPRGRATASTPAHASGARRGSSSRSSIPRPARGHVVLTGPSEPWLPHEARGLVRFIVYDRLAAVIVGVLGIGGALAGTETIVGFFRQHPVAIAPCALAAVSLIEVLLWRSLRHRWHWRLKDRTLAVTLLVTTAITSTAVLVSVPLAVARPAWCPGWLCAPPPLPTAIGSFDGNLEARFTAYQTQAFAVADDATPDSPDRPSSYTEDAVGAGLVSDTPATLSILIHIRNLTDNRETLSIQAVTVRVVSSRQPAARPRVVAPTDPVTFDINAMDVDYPGTGADSRVAAEFTGLPHGDHFQLVAGESDEFDLRIHSDVPSDLRFKVAISYRFAGDPRETSRTLVMDKPFHVLFEDSRHWNPVIAVDNVYVAAPPDGGT